MFGVRLVKNEERLSRLALKGVMKFMVVPDTSCTHDRFFLLMMPELHLCSLTSHLPPQKESEQRLDCGIDRFLLRFP